MNSMKDRKHILFRADNSKQLLRVISNSQRRYFFVYFIYRSKSSLDDEKEALENFLKMKIEGKAFLFYYLVQRLVSS